MSALPKSHVSAEGKEAVEAVFTAERFRKVAKAMDDGEVKPIFRHFGDLNTLNLLILQAELSELQDKFFALASTQDDAEKGDIATYYLGMRRQGYANNQSPEEQAKQKGELLTKLRQALNTYSGLNF